MPIQDLDIFCHFDKQRFTQYGSVDCANWYIVNVPTGKKGQALYPAMGRKHINTSGQNRFVFTSEPKFVFKTINYVYVIVGTQVIKINRFYNEEVIGTVPLGGEVWFAWLAVGTTIYAMLTTENNIYVITENGVTVTMTQVTDSNRPTRPAYVAAFGNRFVVSQRGTPDYHLTQINLGTAGFNPAEVFTIPNPPGPGFPLVNRASGIIRQMGVLHNQLYIFTDFTTDIWSNIPTQIEVAGEVREFPWKLNTSYNWDYGIADPLSLSIDFGMMVFLAKNATVVVSFMMSTGQQPKDISSQAINVLLENSVLQDEPSPFLSGNVDGFLYQYENTIFYHVSAGRYLNFKELDMTDSAHALEYNVSNQKWARVIELNGERNRIQKHVFFTNMHLVTVAGDSAMYQMAGNIYRNELRKPDTDAQAEDAFVKYPQRYTLTTQQIFMQDYAEFITDYVEIDFVFGDKTFYKNEAPFDNTVYVIDEATVDRDCPIYIITEDQESGEDVFVITEDGNTPGFDDNHYNALFKPHIELYYSDDGGITFLSADLREFSPLGQYRWRMRWYRLGTSRNRCYKLVCVSSAPIVVLGAVQNIRRASGGAN